MECYKCGREAIEDVVEIDGEAYHLCKDCWDELEERIRTYVKRKRRKIKVVDAPVEKKQRVDKGKVFALMNAGWDVYKIAAELGVTTSTVYYHMRELRKVGFQVPKEMPDGEEVYGE